MKCVMDPPITETCRRIGKGLSELTHLLHFAIASSRNSEVPGMIYCLQAMLKAKNIISADN